MIVILYNMVLGLVYPFFVVSRIFRKQIPQWNRFLESRQQAMSRIQNHFAEEKNRGVIWLHAASAGELDQALALLREIKRINPDEKVIISVFSLSVDRTSHPEADFFFYLPLDFLTTWFRVIPLIRPRAFVSMTWDAFPNLIYALEFLQVKRYLCNAAMIPTAGRLKQPWRTFYRGIYGKFNGIGVVDQRNLFAFETLGGRNVPVHITGDTRFDAIEHRIKHTTMDRDSEDRLSQLKGNLMILGSTYRECEERLFPILPGLLNDHRGWKCLIFPHHPTEERLLEIESSLGFTGLSFARFSDDSWNRARVIVVDRMGILALAYRKSKFCYVGGGFTRRVHNTGEPAAIGNPVLTGPAIDHSPVALDLEAQETLARCKDETELDHGMRMLMDSAEIRKELSSRAKQYIQSKAGASRSFASTFLQEFF